MTDTVPVERVWSTRRWGITIVALFCFQAGVTWWLSDRTPLLVREETRKLQVRVVPRLPGTDLEMLLELSNPTLFVLPSREGFSGTAWLQVRPLQHRSPGWSNPPQWLPLKPDELLADFGRFAATNQPGRVSLGERLSRPPESRIALSESSLPKPGTRLRIAGQLAGRDLVILPELPTVEHPGLLAPTVISILVDQRGRVFQVSLAPRGSSGSPTTDQLGLTLARSLQFITDPRIVPDKNAQDFDLLRDGRITIQWWTRLPAPVTNAPSVNPVGQPAQLQ